MISLDDILHFLFGRAKTTSQVDRQLHFYNVASALSLFALGRATLIPEVRCYTCYFATTLIAVVRYYQVRQNHFILHIEEYTRPRLQLS